MDLLELHREYKKALRAQAEKAIASRVLNAEGSRSVYTLWRDFTLEIGGDDPATVGNIENLIEITLEQA